MPVFFDRKKSVENMKKLKINVAITLVIAMLILATSVEYVRIFNYKLTLVVTLTKLNNQPAISPLSIAYIIRSEQFRQEIASQKRVSDFSLAAIPLDDAIIIEVKTMNSDESKLIRVFLLKYLEGLEERLLNEFELANTAKAGEKRNSLIVVKQQILNLGDEPNLINQNARAFLLIGLVASIVGLLVAYFLIRAKSRKEA